VACCRVKFYLAIL